MDETTNLFVYGSLQPGAWNHRIVERYVRHSAPGTISGILVNLGSFPALIPGEGIVKGVMLEVDPMALLLTDRLEGVPHFYQRKETTVTLDNDHTATAWTYEHANPTRISDCPRLMVDTIDGIPVYRWKLGGD